MYLEMPEYPPCYPGFNVLTHWGRVTHTCVSKLTIIGSDNDLSPGRRQAIIWTNAGFLLNGPLGTNFSEILIEIHTFSFKKMHWKMSSGKWRPFCLGFNVLITVCVYIRYSLLSQSVRPSAALSNDWEATLWSMGVGDYRKMSRSLETARLDLEIRSEIFPSLWNLERWFNSTASEMHVKF